MTHALFPAVLVAAGSTHFALTSPTSALRADIDVREGRLEYTLFRGKTTLTRPSPIGIDFAGEPWPSIASLTTSTPTLRKKSLELRLGKSHDTVRWNESTLSLSGTKVRVDLRTYDDGFAYRYRREGSKSGYAVRTERSVLRPLHDVQLWTQEGWASIKSCEGVWTRSRLGEKLGLRSGPFTIEEPGGLGYLFLSEAGNFGLDYSGAKYLLDDDGIRTVFPDDATGFTVRRDSFVSPWRVVLATRDLDGLVNSSVIPSLVPDPDPKYFPKGIYTDWVKPGRCAWSFFTRGFHEGNATNYGAESQFTDIAAELGFEYNLADEGWYGFKEGGDQWTALASLKRRGVSQWAWAYYPLQMNDPTDDWRQMRQFLDGLVHAGAKGLEIDFLDSESQDRRRFVDAALRLTAERKLMVQFHGANIPTGESVTWPNEMTREAIRGMEYNLWDNNPPRHYCALPFTRLVAGHGCFTPGYLGHDAKLLGGSSWAMQLATMLAYNSSLLQTPLAPDVLTDALPARSTARKLVSAIPVSWDETRVLSEAKIGELAPFARRKGRDWWIAVLNGESPRTYRIDLRRLGKGKFHVTIVRDDLDRGDAWIVEERTVDLATVLSAKMRACGGFVAWIRPEGA